MNKNQKHIVAEKGVGFIFYAIPTGNRLKRTACPFSQVIKLKVIKFARVNAEFERVDASGHTIKQRLHNFHLKNIFDQTNSGFTLYESKEALNEAFKIQSASVAIRNWDAMDDKLKLKVADTIGVEGLDFTELGL